MASKVDCLALDRASVRTIDQDGHLHVSESAISKANVCPYLGAEIPDNTKLGLNLDKTYMLLRDPEALEKAAASFNGKPLLTIHKPQNAADHDHELVAGSVTNVAWKPPYLVAQLDIWDGGAIDAINSNEQRELSSGYFYTCVMEPGTYEGTPYDGRMTDIVGNHVSLVVEGRAGPDVFVGDSVPPKGIRSMSTMRLTAPSRKAVLAAGAIHVYLGQKLAADQKVDFTAALKGVTKANWKASKPKIKAALDKATAGKLAQDADLEDVITMLDQLDDVTDELADAPIIAKASDDDPMMDADPEMMAKVRDILGPDADDDKVKALCALMTPPAAADVDPEAKPGEKKPDDKGEKAPSFGKDKDMVTKSAMDAAISVATTKAAKDAETSTMARMRAITEAVEETRSVTGKIAAQDSAEDVYKIALETRGVALDGVPPTAFRALFHALPKVNADAPSPRLSMDAAAAKSYAERFPNANRLVR